MAKTKAPLFGLGASGQLGKAIVFGSWKGIGTAREYVKPSNPDTIPQQDQRGYMTAAVATFHTAAFSVADMTAWARLASIQSKVMSGFNVFCKLFVLEAALGNAWGLISAVVISTATDEGFDVDCTSASGGSALHVWAGSRSTFLSDLGAMTDSTGNAWTMTVTGLSADADYFVQVKRGVSATDYSCTGIYKVHTLPATP